MDMPRDLGGRFAPSPTSLPEIGIADRVPRSKCTTKGVDGWQTPHKKQGLLPRNAPPPPTYNDLQQQYQDTTYTYYT